MRAVRFVLGSLLVAAALALVASSCSTPPAQEAYPSKPIEFLVHNQPGSGADLFARTMADIIEKEKISKQPFVVLNKPGGSGAVALAYLLEKKGDPYTVWVFASGNLVTLITDRVKGHTDINELTPIAQVEIDPNVFLVRADSPYKTMKDLVEDARRRPAQVSIGFGSVGGTDHMISYRVAQATGVEFNYLSFGSGAEAMTQMLGGHVDFAGGQPGETAGQIEAGTIRALATATAKRLPGLPDVPTLTELGIPVTFQMVRGLVGPPDMPKDAVQYLEGVFKKMTEAEPWKKYIADGQLVTAYENSAQFRESLTKSQEEYIPLVKHMGLDK